MNKTYYIGLDVHSQNTAIAHALEGSRKDPVVCGSCGGSVQNVERALRKLAKKLEVDFKELRRSLWRSISRSLTPEWPASNASRRRWRRC